MLNIHTHRVTSLDDAERWADERQPARYLHTQAMVYEKHPYIPMGCDQQGRHPDRIPQPAADSAEGVAGDDTDNTESWARVFGWLAAAITVGWVCFLVYVARSAG